MIPLTVRLKNSTVDKHITNQLAGAPSYRSVAPGGFASAQFSLQSPIDVTDPLLAPFTRVYIYDGRNGEIAWEGRLQMPGRSSGDQGQVWSITALGPASHTLDDTDVLIYIDTRLEGWVRDVLESSFIPSTANIAVSTYPTGTTDGVICGFADGGDLSSVTGHRASAGYYAFINSSMEVGALGYGWDAGFTSTNFAVESVVGTNPTYGVIVDNPTANTAGGSGSFFVIDDFSGNRDIVGIRLRKIAGGLNTHAGDIWWAFFQSLRVLGRRMTKSGALVSGAAGMSSSSIWVHASAVVEDLLGRLLPQYDGPNAEITAVDTVDIEHLAYTDGATPNQVLEDLMQIEPQSYWAAWESNSTGRYRFEWKTWPTSPRYEATVDDGFSSPAPAFEQYNKVTIRWRDSRSRVKTTVRTQTVDALAAEGLTRGAYLDLGDELGSASNANTVGDNYLGEHLGPISTGTLNVAGPITDVINGRWVAPWMIRPGELIRVRGVEASYVTNPAAQQRDGLTVFRIVAVELDSEGVATLELDMFTRTEGRALAEVLKKRPRKR